MSAHQRGSGSGQTSHVRQISHSQLGTQTGNATGPVVLMRYRCDIIPLTRVGEKRGFTVASATHVCGSPRPPEVTSPPSGGRRKRGPPLPRRCHLPSRADSSEAEPRRHLRSDGCSSSPPATPHHRRTPARGGETPDVQTTAINAGSGTSRGAQKRSDYPLSAAIIKACGNAEAPATCRRGANGGA